jgi:L-glutamine-phosphate cytidylyltransferase
MRLIILAAGRGSRLNKVTEIEPKPLVPLTDGTPLLVRNLRTADNVGKIDDVVVVTGYKAQRIEEVVEAGSYGLTVSTVFNPFFDVCGPLVSLWMAINHMEDKDYIITNGDTVYGARVFEEACLGNPGVHLTVSLAGKMGKDDIKVERGANDLVVRAGKCTPPEVASAVSSGVLSVCGAESRAIVSAELRRLMRDGIALKRSTIWHSLVNVLAEKKLVRSRVVPRGEWHEIDDWGDYQDLLAPRAVGEVGMQEGGGA